MLCINHTPKMESRLCAKLRPKSDFRNHIILPGDAEEWRIVRLFAWCREEHCGLSFGTLGDFGFQRLGADFALLFLDHSRNRQHSDVIFLPEDLR